MLLEILAAGALASFAPSPEQSKLDDCLILVAIGADQFGWGKAPPNTALAIGAMKDLETCPWSAIGVAPPLMATDDGERIFSIRPPQYGAAREHATVELDVGSAEGGLWLGELRSCSLNRVAGRWRVIECKVKLVT